MRQGWCLPVQIYLLFAVSGTILSYVLKTKYNELNGVFDNTQTFLSHVIMVAIWTSVLYLLCQHNYVNLAWFLLLLPLILLFIFFLLLLVYAPAIQQNVGQQT